MHGALKLHPDSRCAAVTGIEVDVERPRSGTLLLSYQVTGNIGDLCIPPVAAAVRTDELWRHTCFEAFVRPTSAEAYYEFNFAPSTQWASYRFDGYRSGMRVASDIAPPRIEVKSAPDRYTLQASLELGPPTNAKCRLGIAAVIEEVSGRLSYWALAHPDGKPDFHRADCFTCEI
jgi:hypothetical protein